jgi:5-methylcytosine-specific restriction protein B
VQLPNGLSYDEICRDDILKVCQAARNGNRGTLFALRPGEFDRVRELLIQKNPHLTREISETEAVPPLTIITFHASYSYEDFIEGYRPRESGKSGLSLKLEDGIFKRVCTAASKNSEQNYVVLIDEINRANLPKVFGELLTLIELDKREEVSVSLPQSRRKFTIPRNVYIIGTMNTADRSIKLMDAALHRRFAFVEMLPDSRCLGETLIGPLMLSSFLERLNKQISAVVGRDKQIGHSLLMNNGAAITDEEEFAQVFKQEILPLLQEYCHDNYGKLQQLIGEDLVDSTQQRLADSIDDTDKLISVLARKFKAAVD